MLTDLEFKYPHNTAYLLLAVAAAVFFALSFRKKEKIAALLRFHYRARRKALRTALLFLGMGLMAFSLLGPQVFLGYAEVRKVGMDIYVLMDTSKSMLVSDVKPDRMTVAKKIVEELLSHLEGDRIGFIPFASDAYIQMPLTDDYQLARMFLDVMDTDMISGGGTNLAAAIRLANGSFERTSGADRVILIVSDGEEHDNASQSVLQSITDEKTRIYTIGVGTEKGGLVPVYADDGVTVADYMKDADGNPVTSRIHADTLKELAQAGNGAFYQAGFSGMDISALLGELSGLERDVQAAERLRRFSPLYQWFLGAGTLLFMVAWIMPEGRVVS